jgi:hypothetical protein
MAIATYSDLKTTTLEWQERVGDTALSSRAADLIALAEAALNRDLPLRMMRVNTTLTATAGLRTLALPSDFMEPVRLALTTATDFKPLTASDADSMVYFQDGGEPTQWAVSESNIDLNRLADSAYTFQFRYRKKFALTDLAPTNWLLTNAPDVYLFETLKHAGIFTKDPDYAAALGALAAASILSVKRLDARSQSVATLSVDPGLLARGRRTYNGETDW